MKWHVAGIAVGAVVFCGQSLAQKGAAPGRSAAEDRPWTYVLFDLAQELPATGPDIFLFHCSPMNGDRANAAVQRTIKNLEEVVTTLLAIINSATHFDGHWDIIRHDVTHPFWLEVAESVTGRLGGVQQ